jgi:hypothetical protein
VVKLGSTSPFNVKVWRSGSPAHHRAPTDPDVQNSRIVCWRPHTMRYVASPVMWRVGRLPTLGAVLGRIFAT